MRSAPAINRAAWAMLLALLLAARSLAPPGFMPAFEQGHVSIVACPDASGVAPMAGHHHSSGHDRAHHACPYAAASSLGALGPEIAPALAPPLFSDALPALVAVATAAASDGRLRPPSRAPPLGA